MSDFRTWFFFVAWLVAAFMRLSESTDRTVLHEVQRIQRDIGAVLNDCLLTNHKNRYCEQFASCIEKSRDQYERFLDLFHKDLVKEIPEVVSAAISIWWDAYGFSMDEALKDKYIIVWEAFFQNPWTKYPIGAYREIIRIFTEIMDQSKDEDDLKFMLALLVESIENLLVKQRMEAFKRLHPVLLKMFTRGIFPGEDQIERMHNFPEVELTKEEAENMLLQMGTLANSGAAYQNAEADEFAILILMKFKILHTDTASLLCGKASLWCTYAERAVNLELGRSMKPDDIFSNETKPVATYYSNAVNSAKDALDATLSGEIKGLNHFLVFSMELIELLNERSATFIWTKILDIFHHAAGENRVVNTEPGGQTYFKAMIKCVITALKGGKQWPKTLSDAIIPTFVSIAKDRFRNGDSDYLSNLEAVMRAYREHKHFSYKYTDAYMDHLILVKTGGHYTKEQMERLLQMVQESTTSVLNFSLWGNRDLSFCVKLREFMDVTIIHTELATSKTLNAHPIPAEVTRIFGSLKSRVERINVLLADSHRCEKLKYHLARRAYDATIERFIEKPAEDPGYAKAREEYDAYIAKPKSGN